AQYQWHPGHTRFVGHAEYPAEPSVEVESFGMADPDGPILHVKQNVSADTAYELPAASVVVIRGGIQARQASEIDSRKNEEASAIRESMQTNENGR
ncbi:MAG: hypothetical protein WBQ08_04875, partial [Candidatus Sulfotelmatobacter sp.]